MAGWEAIKLCADSLKAAAQHDKSSVIWCGQVDRESMKNPTEPATGGGQAAYSKAAVEAANRLITLGTYPGDPRRRVFRVPHNRSGQEWPLKRHLLFDVDHGRISEILEQPPAAFGEPARPAETPF